MRNLYAEYRDKAKWAFVPAERGRFIRTHVCAALCDCTDCGSAAGNPCGKKVGEFWTLVVPVCGARMKAYKRALRDGHTVDVDAEGEIAWQGKVRVRKGG